MSNSIVNSTLILYNNVSKDFLPTYEKSHYIFTLRDVSKVFEGLLMAEPKTITSRKNLNLLWAHECLRVFCDKLLCIKVCFY